MNQNENFKLKQVKSNHFLMKSLILYTCLNYILADNVPNSQINSQYFGQYIQDYMKAESSKTNHSSPVQFIQNHHLKQYFGLNGPLITYKHPDNNVWTAVFINDAINPPENPSKLTISYEIKINYSNGCHIMFGLTQKNNSKKSGRINSCFMDQQTIVYNGEAGCIWSEGKIVKKTGSKFKQGSKVRMSLVIQKQDTSIIWTINSEPVGDITIPTSKIRKHQLVPYLEMFQKHDQVLWLGQIQ